MGQLIGATLMVVVDQGGVLFPVFPNCARHPFQNRLSGNLDRIVEPFAELQQSSRTNSRKSVDTRFTASLALWLRWSPIGSASAASSLRSPAQSTACSRRARGP